MKEYYRHVEKCYSNDDFINSTKQINTMIRDRFKFEAEKKKRAKIL
ncbi:hypothetical protein QFZ72_003487 [Bacillus sp. V2I10]|nr:hypothetical protein [Bacillus sp. V2I10]